MKTNIRVTILVIAVVGLLSAPASATVRKYTYSATTLIANPLAPNGCTIFYPDNPNAQGIDPQTGCGFAKTSGQWLDPAETYIEVDDNGGGGALPTLVWGEQHNVLSDPFECEQTSGAVNGGVNIPGCYVNITNDTYLTFAGLGNLGALSITPAQAGDPYPAGWRVDWPDQDVEQDYNRGKGTWCHATCDDAVSQARAGRNCTPAEVTALETNYCQTIVGIPQSQWTFLPEPGNTNTFVTWDTGIWNFSADMTEYEGLDSWRYFQYGEDGNPLNNIVYGEYLNANGTSPFTVPLGALAALVISGSLAGAGVWSIKRRQ
jgi:hypothetical protein